MRDEYAIRRVLGLFALALFLAAIALAALATVVDAAGDTRPRACAACGGEIERPVGRWCSAACARDEDGPHE